MSDDAPDSGLEFEAVFPVGARVRLCRNAFGVPKGSIGVVIDAYGREALTYVVRFATAEREVLSEDLERVAVVPRTDAPSAESPR